MRDLSDLSSILRERATLISCREVHVTSHPKLAQLQPTIVFICKKMQSPVRFETSKAFENEEQIHESLLDRNSCSRDFTHEMYDHACQSNSISWTALAHHSRKCTTTYGKSQICAISSSLHHHRTTMLHLVARSRGRFWRSRGKARLFCAQSRRE
jgi:hypothetical protein